MRAPCQAVSGFGIPVATRRRSPARSRISRGEAAISLGLVVPTSASRPPGQGQRSLGISTVRLVRAQTAQSRTDRGRARGRRRAPAGQRRAGLGRGALLPTSQTTSTRLQTAATEGLSEMSKDGPPLWSPTRPASTRGTSCSRDVHDRGHIRRDRGPLRVWHGSRTTSLA